MQHASGKRVLDPQLLASMSLGLRVFLLIFFISFVDQLQNWNVTPAKRRVAEIDCSERKFGRVSSTRSE